LDPLARLQNNTSSLDPPMNRMQPALTPAAQLTEVEQTALDWFVRRAGGAFDAGEETGFQAWLKDDPAHAQAYARQGDNWRMLDALPPDAVCQLKRKLSAERVALAPPKPRWQGWWRGMAAWVPQGALAAVFLMLAGGGQLAWNHWQRLPVFHESFSTSRGEQVEVVLPEGSRLLLDTLTALEATLYRDRREIRLPSGQAEFEVQGDVARPFHVKAGTLRITAVGTRFAVRYTPGVAGSEGVQVAVQEGRVQVTQAGAPGTGAAPLEIRAGQQIESDGAGALGAVSEIAATGFAPWRESRVSFDNVRLDQALAEFARYGPVHLSVREPTVAALRVTGTFDPRRLDNFTRLLPRVLPVKLRQPQAGRDGGLAGQAASDIEIVHAAP
jgi:transmembrane sensor